MSVTKIPKQCSGPYDIAIAVSQALHDSGADALGTGATSTVSFLFLLQKVTLALSSFPQRAPVCLSKIYAHWGETI